MLLLLRYLLCQLGNEQHEREKDLVAGEQPDAPAAKKDEGNYTSEKYLQQGGTLAICENKNSKQDLCPLWASLFSKSYVQN